MRDDTDGEGSVVREELQERRGEEEIRRGAGAGVRGFGEDGGRDGWFGGVWRASGLRCSAPES